MCGRYNLFSELKVIAERFQLNNASALKMKERYNIAPGQDIFAVARDGEVQNAGTYFRWGLVPGWAKDPKIGYKMINARAETIDVKPSFKNILKRNRCLIIADGFYEWKKEEDRKQPYHITLKNKELFAFAGLWDEWEHEGEILKSCTIITTEANHLMQEIHHRMPVILTRENEDAWLNSDQSEAEELTSMLLPYDSSKMEAYPISTMVNYAKNEGKEIINSL